MPMPFGKKRHDAAVAPVEPLDAKMAGSDNLESRIDYGVMHIDAALSALRKRDLVAATALRDVLLDLRTLLTDGTPPSPIDF